MSLPDLVLLRDEPLFCCRCRTWMRLGHTTIGTNGALTHVGAEDDEGKADAACGPVEPVSEVATSDGRTLLITDHGEVVDVIEPKGQSFAVTDRDTAEWVLEKMADDDAELAAIEARKAALVANLDAQATRIRRSRESWERRYGAQIEQVARDSLRGKERTAVFDNGKVAFRKTQPRIVVGDHTAAARWLSEQDHLTDLHDEAVTYTPRVKTTPLKGHENELPPDLFTCEPAGESVSISTGIEN